MASKKTTERAVVEIEYQEKINMVDHTYQTSDSLGISMQMVDLAYSQFEQII